MFCSFFPHHVKLHLTTATTTTTKKNRGSNGRIKHQNFSWASVFLKCLRSFFTYKKIFPINSINSTTSTVLFIIKNENLTSVKFLWKILLFHTNLLYVKFNVISRETQCLQTLQTLSSETQLQMTDWK